MPAALASFAPTAAIAVDWHGAEALRSLLRAAAGAAGAADSLPWLYFNFRVFSANAGADLQKKSGGAATAGDDDDDDDDDAVFYAARERAAVRLATRSIALCEVVVARERSSDRALRWRYV